MTLETNLQRKLAELRTNNGGPVSRPVQLTVEDGAWKVVLSTDQIDTIGVLVRELTVVSLDAPVPLAQAAQAIADRVTGLLEPLHLLEVDTARQVALLRSNTPTANGDILSYYEVIRQADGTSQVRRYQSQRTSSGRQQIPFAMTHEVIAKLARDLAI